MVSPAVRWAGLSLALAGTVAAILIDPTPEQEAGGAAAPRAKPSAPANARAMGVPLLAEADGDPFQPHEWATARPPVPEVAAAFPAPLAAALDVKPVEAGPPPAPPLPFRYVGRFSDEKGGVVYVTQGEQTVLLRLGDLIDHTYKVAAVTADRIEFDYLPSGERQSLPIPAAE